MSLNAAAATNLLARTHWRILANRLWDNLRHDRVKTLTISAFLVIYGIAAYALVAAGLNFVHRLPLLGPLLTERLVYVLFFFFFVMLVISNATITSISLFRRKDMEWQVALPVPVRGIVMWKTLEGVFLASWGLMILSAPILLALGRVFQAGWLFYAVGAVGMVCLVSISAHLSTWLLLLIVRFARRWWWYPIGIVAVTAFAYVIIRFWSTNPESAKAGDVVANLNQVLRHTDLCMHPLLPSTWVSETLFAASRGLPARAGFFLLLLVSYGLFGILVTAKAASTFFYPAWNRVMTAAPTQRARAASMAWFRTADTPESATLTERLFGIDRPSAAVVLKDIRTFLREPAQWGQTTLIFGLLFFYASNLRRLGYDLQNPFWIVLISHLNLLVCSLALSTLTTRFIFPQISLEGQRMWILGLSPIPLHRILSLKLRLSASVIGLLTTTLVLISSLSLSLSWQRIFFFCSAILLLSYGLTALALAIGTLVPNFRETNPAKIVSGFGGTVCLIFSFIYIMFCMGTLVIPPWLENRALVSGSPLSPPVRFLCDLGALAGVAFWTTIFGFAPYRIAKKRTKDLEYLRLL